MQDSLVLVGSKLGTPHSSARIVLLYEKVVLVGSKLSTPCSSARIVGHTPILLGRFASAPVREVLRPPFFMVKILELELEWSR